MKKKEEGRFKEIISLATVVDTKTGKEYRCEYCISDELLDLMNELNNNNELFEKRIIVLEENLKAYDDFIKKQGYTAKDIWKGFSEN